MFVTKAKYQEATKEIARLENELEMTKASLYNTTYLSRLQEDLIRKYEKALNTRDIRNPSLQDVDND